MSKKHKIEIKSYRYDVRFEKLAEDFDASLREDCDEHIVEFANTFGIGYMKGINFQSGLSLQVTDVNFVNETEFHYQLGRRHPIMFIYVKEGYVEVEEIKYDYIQKVSAGEAILFAPKGDSDYSILYPANTSVKVAQVNLVRFLYLEKIECDLDTIPEPLQEMFKDTTGAKTFIISTVSDPASVNAITNLFDNQQSGLERKLHLEAYATKLITSLIRTFRVENNPNQSGYFFTKENINLINQAKNYILENIEETPTVKELSLKLGINTNKLQKGFNLLFNKSVRQFIISAKLHKAQQLIEKSDHTISEIADQLGYTNKGHFSQLFKKEFGILPSEYNIRSRTLDV
ncbi:helix-turn-helix domain-containing protein [Portibacter marinus]|uniref:helix-turn-helix domain-containing protein n=1 Tax=Portibacter marinus TaxID=2898660 RepID=UPI001F31F348|nr:AraC family transcriptional regulator [Portibacter marinus]